MAVIAIGSVVETEAASFRGWQLLQAVDASLTFALVQMLVHVF